MNKYIIFFLICTSSWAGIINSDDRHEIFDSPIEIQDLSKSIAALVLKSRVEEQPNGDYKLLGSDYIEDFKFCSDERFVSTQKLTANCSASLVGESTILTAAHCIDLEGQYSIENYYVVFDYKYMNDQSENMIIERKNVVEIKSILHYDFDFPGDKDIALLELSTPVRDRTPLKISKKRIQEGEEIFMLGFPLGLPMKYHDNGYVTDSSTFLDGIHSFTHNLDTFSVNSGSSIFSKNTNEIIGVLVRGVGPNYTLDQERNCNIWGNGDEHSGEANYIDLLNI